MTAPHYSYRFIRMIRLTSYDLGNEEKEKLLGNNSFIYLDKRFLITFSDVTYGERITY